MAAKEIKAQAAILNLNARFSHRHFLQNELIIRFIFPLHLRETRGSSPGMYSPAIAQAHFLRIAQIFVILYGIDSINHGLLT